MVHQSADLTALLGKALRAGEAIATCAKDFTHLGDEVSPLLIAGHSRGRHGHSRRYDNGTIYWTPESGAHPVSYGVATLYDRLDGPGGRLGYPLTPEVGAAPSPQGTSGVYQRFESTWDYADEVCSIVGLRCGATIYWSSVHGPHATWGGIGEHYERTGGTYRVGFPVSGEYPVEPPPGGVEAYRQDFEGGSIFWSDATNSILVDDVVASVMRGLTDSVSAFPTLEKADTSPSPYGTAGTYQSFCIVDRHGDPATHVGLADRLKAKFCIVNGRGDPATPFRGGTVYLSQHGNLLVTGDFDVAHRRQSGTAGSLGFPISPEEDVEITGRSCHRQRFEGGALYKRDGGDVIAVEEPIWGLLSEAGVHDALGLPIDSAEGSTGRGGVAVQFYDKGVVTVRDGSAAYWLRPLDSDA